MEAALYPTSRDEPAEDVDWTAVEKDLSGHGVMLNLLRQVRRETHPDGMCYVTWCRRFREWRRYPDVTMRPGERMFVDYAGITVPLLIDRVEREARLFMALMGMSGWPYIEATLSQKIDDWCASHVRCFEDMGRAPHLVVPDNVKAAVKKPSRYEPVRGFLRSASSTAAARSPAICAATPGAAPPRSTSTGRARISAPASRRPAPGWSNGPAISCPMCTPSSPR